MVDILDHAADREHRERVAAIDAHLARQTCSGPSLSHCRECDDEIVAKRRALGGITRCVPCQTHHERRVRH